MGLLGNLNAITFTFHVLNKHSVEKIDGNYSQEDIIKILCKNGIRCDQSSVSNWQLVKDDEQLPTAGRKLPTANCQLPTDPVGYRKTPPRIPLR